MSDKCGCGSDSSSKRACPDSKSEKKSGFSKSPCKDTSGKGKCHESHEDFKKKPSGGGGAPCNSAADSARDQCVSSYQEFTRSVSEASPCGGERSKQADCPEVKSRREQRSCKESQVKSVPCSAQTKHEPCPSSLETSSDNAAKRTPCSNSVDSISKQKDSPCASKLGKPEDASLYSQITSRCKDMAKEFIKPKSKSKCSNIDEPSRNSICNKTTPQPTLPCPPKTEKGAGYGPTCCTSRATCPESKTSSWTDFFPLDARNPKLNSCIDKYSKIDPGQVISQCSQFANKTTDRSGECAEQERRSQQQCRQRGGRSEPPRSVMPALISPRARVLIGRWAPTAALYLATSALATLYLTEWKVVPVYQDNTDKESKP